jgi:hypothetical protein
MNPGSLTFWVDEPDDRDTEGEVIVNFFLQVYRSIIGGKDLNGNFGRRGDDTTRWATASDNDYVGNTEASGLHLNADLDSRPKHGCVGEDVCVSTALCIAVTDFPHITLHYPAVDVLMIGLRNVA